MTLDNWAKEVGALARVVAASGTDFTEAEKEHWVDRLIVAAATDKEAVR